MNILNKTKYFLAAIVFSFSIFNFVSFVSAQNTPTVDSVLESTRGETKYEKDGNIINYPKIVGRFFGVFMSMLGMIFVGLAVYAGYLWMTARGDEASVTKAKETLEHAIIGIIIVAASYVIAEFLLIALAKNYSNVTGY